MKLAVWKNPSTYILCYCFHLREQVFLLVDELPLQAVPVYSMSSSKSTAGRGRTKGEQEQPQSDSEDSDAVGEPFLEGVLPSKHLYSHATTQADNPFSNSVLGTFRYRSRVQQYNTNIEVQTLRDRPLRRIDSMSSSRYHPSTMSMRWYILWFQGKPSRRGHLR